MFGPIGFPELMVIFLVILLLFGPKKLPDFAKFLGKAIREFRKTVNEARSTIEDELSDIDVTRDLKDIDRDIKDLTETTKIDFRDPYQTAEEEGESSSSKKPEG